MGFFALVGLWPLAKGLPVHKPALYVATIFLVLALLIPMVLRPLNVLWFKFGMLLHKLVSPVVMAVIFFTVLTPMGILLRLLNKDILKLKIDKSQKSYWVLRTPPGPEPKSLINQF